jgi:hypothetical protein
MRRTFNVILASVVVSFVVAAGSAARVAAHHGWTGYGEKETTLTGTITTFSYENPHASVDLNVDGKSWRVVLAPPSRMQSRGLQKDMLKVGGKATVAGYIHKTVATELRAERITIGDKTTELR